MNDIIIREQPDQSGLLNAHVVGLRDTLLDFEGTIIDRLRSSSEGTLITEPLAPYSKISKSAERLMEAECPKFFFDKFFRPLWDEMAVKDEDSRRVSRNKLYYDYFDLARQRPWNLFGPSSRYCELDWRGHAEPKPDVVASFPIYNQFMPYLAPKSAPCQWGASSVPEDNILENFSSSTLSHLAYHGLEPSAAASLDRKLNRYVIFPTQAVCFPWLVVEHRKDAQSEKQCYWQAANAGASAILMLRILSRYAEVKEDDAHIPPVVTVTTVGTIVRVWVTYSRQYSTELRMDCIWRGNMTVIVDVVKLEAILGNLHTWAMRKLRPWISSYIDQWKDIFPESGNTSLKLLNNSNWLPDAAANDVNRLLSPPSSIVSSDDSEGNQDCSDGSSFRKILQTEDQKLMDQSQRALQESVGKKVGAQTLHAEPREAPKPRQPSPTQTQRQVCQDSPVSSSSTVTTRSSVPPQHSASSSIDLEKSPSQRTTCIRPGDAPKDMLKKRVRVPWRTKYIYVKLPDVPPVELTKSKPGVAALTHPKSPTSKILEQCGPSLGINASAVSSNNGGPQAEMPIPLRTTSPTIPQIDLPFKTRALGAAVSKFSSGVASTESQPPITGFNVSPQCSYAPPPAREIALARMLAQKELFSFEEKLLRLKIR